MKNNWPYITTDDGRRLKWVCPEWAQKLTVDEQCQMCALNIPDDQKRKDFDCLLDNPEFRDINCSQWSGIGDKDIEGFFTEIFKCDKCNADAVWFYGPGTEKYCDDCVPRYPCGCNYEPKDDNPDNKDPENWEYLKDDQGRDLVCANYIFADNHINPNMPSDWDITYDEAGKTVFNFIYVGERK